MKSRQQSERVQNVGMLRACRLFESLEHMALVTGIGRTQISYIVNGVMPATAVQAALVERHTGGRIRMSDIRPDLFPAGKPASLTQDDFRKPGRLSAAAAALAEELGFARDSLFEANPPSGKRTRAKGKTTSAQPKVK